MAGRIQPYDATFGKRTAESFTLHSQFTGQPASITGLPGAAGVRRHQAVVVPESQPGMGVKTRNAGVRINVLDERNYSVVVRLTPTTPA